MKKSKSPVKVRLIFTKRATPFILETFEKTTDKKGFVIDAKTKEFVLDADGKKFKSNKLCGLIKDKNGNDKWLTSIFQLTKAELKSIAKTSYR